jgi:glycosyltransferase involved in cell wall biosynthesis
MNQDQALARNAGYGGQTIDKIIEREKPDAYIGIEDIWAFSGYTDKKWWNNINCMIWTTLDSLPILPEAVKNANKIKNYYTWSSFASKELNRLGHKHVDTLHGAIDTTNFFKFKSDEKLKLRSRLKIDKDDFIIGFVFRNQLRKSVPNLLEGYKIFCEKNPECSAKLLLHTHWKEGWDIPRLIKEKGINPKNVLTTYVCAHCKNFEIKPYEEEKKDCGLCGAEKTQVTPNTRLGVTEEQLNEIYNLMNVYCHPFTSGGQEIPIQEAKLVELVTLVTNYSCGEDCCTEDSAGLPLSWSEYREPGTQFIKASTNPESIASQLKKVYSMKDSKLKLLGEQARDFVIKNYSIEAIGKKLESIIDNMPEVNWDYDFKPIEKNPNYIPPEIKNDDDFIKDIYKNILQLDVNESDDGFKHWKNRLSTDMDRDGVLQHFQQVAKKENKKQEKIDFTDILDKEDEGNRILFSMPQSIGDIYMSTTLLKNIKELYPNYNIYYATKPEYFEILDGNPYIHKVIPYSKSLDSLPAMEGQGNHKGFFEIAFLPFIGTQKMLNYIHNGKDKIQFELCT